ncbi:MAG: hypothetical protein H0V63_07110 [Burkholderiaceae bacterium]|nr:hypothetical protein [Burkholderiaceae bacterium]
MANTILTPTAVTREALRVLHQKLNFIGNINRQYDDSFAKDGAKIGDSLKIRLPNEYTVRTGLTMSSQDTTEASTTLQVATVKGVDLNFTSTELTLSLDDFSDRILKPAMSVLAANIEADALSMYKDVYNVVDQDGVAFNLLSVLKGRQMLQDNLTPAGDRSSLLSTGSSVKLVDAVKGLFQDSEQISKQYREGKMGRTGGFDHYENTLLVAHTTGTAPKATTYVTNGVNQVGSSIVVSTGTATFKKGDVITFAGVFSVHSETKASTGVLKQFVITADYAGGAGSIQIAPAVVATGGRQNVSNAIANGSAIVKVAAGANELINADMVFHKDAFTFATADLVLPKGVDFAAREVMDGISMSVVRDFTVADRSFPCRLDVLYGFKTLRAEWAARIHADA